MLGKFICVLLSIIWRKSPALPWALLESTYAAISVGDLSECYMMLVCHTWVVQIDVWPYYVLIFFFNMPCQ